MSRHFGLRRRIGDFRSTSLDSITSQPRHDELGATGGIADLSDIVEYNDELLTVTPTDVPIPEGVVEKEVHDREVKGVLNEMREGHISSVSQAAIEFLRKANEELAASITEDQWVFEHTPVNHES